LQDIAKDPNAVEQPHKAPPSNVGGESVLTFEIPVSLAGRLDSAIPALLPEKTTKSQVQRYIREGFILIDGIVAKKPGSTVRAGQTITFRVEQCHTQREAANQHLVTCLAESLPLDIVYEDAFLILVNKAAGMTMHPAPGLSSGTLVNALLYHVGVPCHDIRAKKEEDEEEDADDEGGDVEGEPSHQLSTASASTLCRPGIVHRIDRNTTGLVVVAKNNRVHAHLAAQFAAHTNERLYVALVWGIPKQSSGTIRTGIARDPTNRLRMAPCPLDGSKGREAITHYTVLDVAKHAAMVQFRLETGRTHQIRVHCRYLGHPMVGDAVYGGADIGAGPKTPCRQRFFEDLFRMVLPRHALHAAVLGFVHPSTGEVLRRESPLPTDMVEAWRRLKEDG